ncbi:hypothetical protein CFP56_030185 [Quercus suber]|uniref:Uncharacterized protein n=1 Tax=Quercus suber TaxID=58331 RepID=A0AAW0LWZ4_QUESU
MLFMLQSEGMNWCWPGWLARMVGQVRRQISEEETKNRGSCPLRFSLFHVICLQLSILLFACCTRQCNCEIARRQFHQQSDEKLKMTRSAICPWLCQ